MSGPTVQCGGSTGSVTNFMAVQGMLVSVSATLVGIGRPLARGGDDGEGSAARAGLALPLAFAGKARTDEVPAQRSRIAVKVVYIVEE